MPREHYHIFGPLYGFHNQFMELAKLLGYDLSSPKVPVPPPGRTPVSLGGIIGPGGGSLGLLRLFMEWSRQGLAVVVPGEAEEKLFRYALGRLDHPEVELADLWPELRRMGEGELAGFLEEYERFFASLPPFRVLGGELVVVHRALTPESLAHPLTMKTRKLCIQGMKGKEVDGSPLLSLDWVWEWNGVERVVCAGVPTRESRWVNRCILLDGGAPWGGRIICLLYPELEMVTLDTPRVRGDRELADFPQ